MSKDVGELERVKDSDNIEKLAKILKANNSMGEFKVAPFYDITEDALILYFKDKRSHEVRISENVSLFVALDNSEIIGVEIREIEEVKNKFHRTNKVDDETWDQAMKILQEKGETPQLSTLKDGLPTD